MAGLFESAVGRPALIVEIVDVLQSAAAEAELPIADPLRFFKAASRSSVFRTVAVTRLGEVAARHDLTFQMESAVRPEDATRQMAAATRLSKHNPTRVAIGRTFGLLFLGAGLMFAPSAFAGVGSTK